MSRVEEALKQAGIGVRPPEPNKWSPAETLGYFPQALEGPEPEVRPDDEPGPVDFAPAETPDQVHEPIGSLDAGQEKLVDHPAVKSAPVEQYRRLAAQLHQMQQDHGAKIVMVASARPGEGKTLTAANLSLTLSQSYGRHVLLVDADLRKPALDRLLHAPHVRGLTEGLRASEQEPVKIVDLTDRLSFLSAGRPERDPMEGLTSARMRGIVENAAAKYDWVILDTPPITLLPDAHLLAAMVEAVVFVIQAGKTPCAAIQRAVEMIGREKICGVVLNRVADDALPGGNYEHYYEYGGSDAKRSRFAGFRLGAQRAVDNFRSPSSGG